MASRWAPSASNSEGSEAAAVLQQKRPPPQQNSSTCVPIQRTKPARAHTQRARAGTTTNTTNTNDNQDGTRNLILIKQHRQDQLHIILHHRHHQNNFLFETENSSSSTTHHLLLPSKSFSSSLRAKKNRIDGFSTKCCTHTYENVRFFKKIAIPKDNEKVLTALVQTKRSV